MNRASPHPYHGTDLAVFEALAEMMAAAQVYAGTAADLASVQDKRGVAHSIRCAAACVANAAGLLEDLRDGHDRAVRKLAR